MKSKINDNKTVREESVKKLIHSALKIDVKSISELEKTILIEVLDNGKSFAELQNTNNLTSSRQRTILENTVNKLGKHLETINDKQRQYEESQKELIELRHWKILLEASVEKEKAIDPKLKKTLSLIVQDVGFSNRVLQIFFNNNIFAVSDIVKYSKRNMSRLRNCGKKSIKEIEDFLKKNELSWGMKV